MDDYLVLFATAILGLFLIAVTFYLTRLRSGSANDEEGPGVRAYPNAVARGPRGVPRMRRRRMIGRGAHADDDESEEEEDENPVLMEVDLPSGATVGAKKMKKLEEKAAKKAQREALEQERKEKKIHEENLEKQRRKEEARVAAEEVAKAAEEQRLKEEREKQEYEEYLKLKADFTVEEEGEQAENEQDVQSLLQQFIEYIQTTKVVVLEDLAAHFKIKTQDAIDRVKILQDEGKLSGVIDDRGKFIYITQEEYRAVAKFIKQRGRVSISELADSMNRLINLNPKNRQTELPADVTVLS